MRKYDYLDIEFAVASFDAIKRKMDEYANTLNTQGEPCGTPFETELHSFKDVHKYWVNTGLAESPASQDRVEFDRTFWNYNNPVKFLMMIGVFVENHELLDDTNNQGLSHEILKEWDIMFAKHRFNLDDDTTNIMRI